MITLYSYEPAKDEYSGRDRVSLDLNESFASFEEMLAAALRTRLEDEYPPPASPRGGVAAAASSSFMVMKCKVAER